MLFILYTTGRCNLACRYCGGSFDPKVVPWEVGYDLRSLEELIGEGDVVAFYGGEPLLNLEFIRRAIDSLRAERFVLQTNGLLLHLLDSQILRKLDAILVSIDGVEWLTDMWRGRDVYRRVLENVKSLKAKGYEGDLIARMTVTESSDIYRDVTHLLSLNFFDHVHWQLSLVWTDRREWRDLWGWIRGSYARGLRMLLDKWIEELEEGRVKGIAPFQGILRRMLEGGGPTPPCGSGVDSFTILPDGRVTACPIAVKERWAHVGELGKIDRKTLQNYKPPIREPCLSCPYLKICGTRCLYTHLERFWGEEGIQAICETSKTIINLLSKRLPRIKKLLNETIHPQHLLYPKYNNTVEIMP